MPAFTNAQAWGASITATGTVREHTQIVTNWYVSPSNTVYTNDLYAVWTNEYWRFDDGATTNYYSYVGDDVIESTYTMVSDGTDTVITCWGITNDFIGTNGQVFSYSCTSHYEIVDIGVPDRTNTFLLRGRDAAMWELYLAQIERAQVVGDVPTQPSYYWHTDYISNLQARKDWIEANVGNWVCTTNADTNGVYDAYFEANTNATTFPVWDATNLLAYVGAPTNWLDYTPTWPAPLIATNTVTLSGTNDVVTNTFWLVNIYTNLTGTNGQIISIVMTNEDIADGFSGYDYQKHDVVRLAMDELRLTQGRVAIGAYVVSSDVVYGDVYTNTYGYSNTEYIVSYTNDGSSCSGFGYDSVWHSLTNSSTFEYEYYTNYPSINLFTNDFDELYELSYSSDIYRLRVTEEYGGYSYLEEYDYYVLEMFDGNSFPYSSCFIGDVACTVRLNDYVGVDNYREADASYYYTPFNAEKYVSSGGISYEYGWLYDLDEHATEPAANVELYSLLSASEVASIEPTSVASVLGGAYLSGVGRYLTSGFPIFYNELFDPVQYLENSECSSNWVPEQVFYGMNTDSLDGNVNQSSIGDIELSKTPSIHSYTVLLNNFTKPSGTNSIGEFYLWEWTNSLTQVESYSESISNVTFSVDGDFSEQDVAVKFALLYKWQFTYGHTNSP